MSAQHGRFEGHEHRLMLRVYYQDTDAGGVAYHARYFDFGERARMEMLALLGISQQSLAADHGLMFVVRHGEIDWFSPALLEDMLEVASWVHHLGGASLGITHEIRREGEVLARLVLRLVCVERATVRPARIPDRIRAAVQPYFFAQSAA
jgi:acyl-CoA thioester hydrolase